MRSIGLVVVVLGLASAGCSDRKHLTKSFGESYRGAFAVQQQRTAKPAVAVVGLDAQEAGITADNYRQTLAPKGGEAKAEPTVIVAPPSREQPMRLAPSVPKE